MHCLRLLVVRPLLHEFLTTPPLRNLIARPLLPIVRPYPHALFHLDKCLRLPQLLQFRYAVLYRVLYRYLYRVR